MENQVRSNTPGGTGECPKCESFDVRIGIAKTVTGSIIYPLFCNDCGNVMARYVKKEIAMRYQDSNGTLRDVLTNTGRKIAEGILSADDFKKDPCEVCGSQDKIESHHWAPRHLFGDECEMWPQSNLCQPCHVKWHQTVTPEMGSKRGLGFVPSDATPR